MAENNPRYIPLTRKNRRFTGSSQMWISGDNDHLLLVRTAWFVQHYSRFRLRDIQALVVHGWDLSLPAHVGAIVLAAVLMALALRYSVSTFAKGFFVFLFVPVITALIVNLARGQRGGVTLITSVTRKVLPPITRLNKAQDFVLHLTPLIQAAQSDIPVPSAQQVQPGAPASESAPELPKPKPPLAISAVLYAAVLLTGIISLVALRWRVPDSIGNLSWTLTFAGAALGFYVAVTDRGSWPARVLGGLTGLISTADLAASGAAVFSFVRGKNPPLPAGYPEHLKGLPMWAIEYSRVVAPIVTMLGIAGVAFTVYRWGRQEKPR